MLKSGFDPNAAEEAIDARQLQEHLTKQAEAVVETAKQFAPVRTGAYRRGLKVVVRGQKVYASGTDFKSHWIEWGTSRQHAQAVIRRAARAHGLELDEREFNG